MSDYIKIQEIKAAEYNPRIMPDKEMEALKESLMSFGFVEPVVINSNPERYGTLIGGHQRLSAVTALIASNRIPGGVLHENDGYKVPAMLVNLDIIKEKALNLALNKIKGRWDDAKLAGIILDLKAEEIIPATGFSDDEISRILDGEMKDEDDEDEGEGEPETPQSTPGTIYELGPHRLICGDSTNPETYHKLLGEERASMIWTDPPYNVAYSSRGGALHKEGKESIQNDNMDSESFKKLADDSFASMMAFLKEGGSLYACSGWSSYPQFYDSLRKNGFKHAGVIIWVKNVASMGWNDYRYKHEWVAKAKKPDKKTAEAIIYGWKTGTHEFNGAGELDVWDMPRKAVTKYLHPTEKPDWLPMRAIRNSSKRGEIVLNPFAGSGSVMAAAEKVGRRAFMIELDPKFCDVIRKRWARIEKQKAAANDSK